MTIPEEKTKNDAPASSDVQKNKEVEEKKEGSCEGSRKKVKRTSSILLEGKSELFKEIIDIALSCEKLETEAHQLKIMNDALKKNCEQLTKENAALMQRMEEKEALFEEKIHEINELKMDIAQRNEVIDIVRTDKDESAQEYKNAIAAALKIYYTDFIELKEEGTTDDIGLAVIDTFENVIKVLNKNGILLGK